MFGSCNIGGNETEAIVVEEEEREYKKEQKNKMSMNKRIMKILMGIKIMEGYQGICIKGYHFKITTFKSKGCQNMV
jgi:hypothetical protein